MLVGVKDVATAGDTPASHSRDETGLVGPVQQGDESGRCVGHEPPTLNNGPPNVTCRLPAMLRSPQPGLVCVSYACGRLRQQRDLARRRTALQRPMGLGGSRKWIRRANPNV